MTILFGHPSSNPNSLHAALAHLESGRLEAFCVPWMPSDTSLHLLRAIPGLGQMSDRLGRRRFKPLAATRLIQGRLGEWRRLAQRVIGRGHVGLSYEANDWLMRTMARESRRPQVTAVHAYEDCSLLQFNEAKRLGKACIYDMPIGFYPAWEGTQRKLAQQYADWLPTGGLSSNGFVRPEQKLQEMALADLVLVPSDFVAETVRSFHPDKAIMIAAYGVDAVEWSPPAENLPCEPLIFLFAGQCSVRKGIPLLLNAWHKADLQNARLHLVGNWLLNEDKKTALDSTVTWFPPQPQAMLRLYYQSAHIFVLPTFFEGRALVVGEAMASGLPVLTTVASGASDLVNESTGRLVEIGDLDNLVDALRWFSDHRDDLPMMRKAARAATECCTWQHYRRCVSDAVAPLV